MFADFTVAAAAGAGKPLPVTCRRRRSIRIIITHQNGPLLPEIVEQDA